MNDAYTRKPIIPAHLRCPMCWHALVDHDVVDWDDYYSPIQCFCCNCTVTDPDVIRRICDARWDRPQ